MTKEVSVTLPVAHAQPGRSNYFGWLIVLAALSAGSWLAYTWNGMRGPLISIYFDESHGLKEGDALRVRGALVGTVEKVLLSDDLEGVDVTVRLFAHSTNVMREGSRFWIVRPELELGRWAGLETLVGARYIEGLPGEGETLSAFYGLNTAPVVARIESADLVLTLESKTASTANRGAPVFYRKFPVGKVLSVGPGSNATVVETTVHIPAAYAFLVCEKTVFWDSGGIEMSVGFASMSIRMGTVPTLVTGGISFATPEHGATGRLAKSGDRFQMAPKPKDDWEKWSPAIPIGVPLRDRIVSERWTLPIHSVALRWTERKTFEVDKEAKSFFTHFSRGLIGPADLFEHFDRSKARNALIEVGTRGTNELPRYKVLGDGLALLEVSADSTPVAASSIVELLDPTDCLVVRNASEPPIALTKREIRKIAHGWAISSSPVKWSEWHGASVVSLEGDIIGVLLACDQSGAKVALLAKHQALME